MTYPFGLTPRQVEVLGLLAEGLSNEEIGEKLYITLNTVKAQMRRIGKRMGCGDRAGIVALAFRAGVLDLPEDLLLAKAARVQARRRAVGRVR